MKNILGFWLVGLCAASAWGAGAPLLLETGALDTSAAAPQQTLQMLRRGARVAPVQRLSARGTAPWLVQFEDVVQDEWRAALEAAGATIKGYVPENGYLVEAAPKQIAAIAALDHVAYVGEFLPEYKRAAQVRAKLARVRAAQEADAYSACRVLLFSGADLAAVAQQIEALTGAPVAAAVGEQIRTDLTAAQVEEITGWGEVHWVEAYVKPRWLNDVAVRTNMMNVSNAWTALGLTGTNQIIAVCDTGLDSGNTNTLHRDFSNKLVWAQALGRTGDWSDPDSHGTHVAGSVLGSGSMSTGRYKGVAYQAKLVFQSVLDSGGGLGGLPDDLNDLFRAAFTNGARIHSDSWGAANAGYYDTDCRNLDMFVWSNQTLLVVVAAGNEGTDANNDGVVDLDSMDTPGTAKNCLTVGASENWRVLSSTYGASWTNDYKVEPIYSDAIAETNVPHGLVAFSSRGPCDDGRIKPDVVAPGTFIISTRSRASSDTAWGVAPNTNYLYMGGTSMATPLTSGAAALMRQWLTTTGGIANPSAALLKALLINGARDMTPGQYGTGAYQEIAARPDNAQGFGHVDLYATLQPATNQFLNLYDTNSLATGQTNVFTFTVSAGSTNKIIATLAYADYWATAGSTKRLINDLDLTVIKPGGTTNFANGRTSKDATNNVELVELAADEAGTYTVVVAARTVPSGSPQAYALVVRGPADEPLDPEYGLRDDGGVNLPTLTYWYDGLGADVVEQGSNFNGRALGTRSQLYLKGAALKTWKSGAGDVTGTTFHYKIWEDGSAEPGTYSTRSVGWTSDDGGGNQTWANYGAEIDALSGLVSGSYNHKVLFTVAGTGVPGILTNGPFTATFDIAPVPAPGNLRASATNETDFTAAWDAVSGATGYRLDVGTNATFSGAGGTAADLFISEYVEGSSNNKAIEIFNGTGAAVNLGTGGYTLRVYANGSTTPTTITLSGTVVDNDVFVVANSSANAAILAQADQTSGSLTHNGNDVIALAQNSVNLDVVGTIGSSANFGLDVTKVRKSSVAAGTATYATGEWDDYAVDTTAYLGGHTFSGGTGAPAYVPGYSNRTVAGTSQIVTGLTANTAYYFRARTEAAFGTSTNSATASVTTQEEAVPGTPPTMDAIPAQTTYVGANFECAVTAQEPDSDPVTFACTSAVDVATWDLDVNTGDFLFIPTTNEMGTNVFSFTATDKDGTSAPALMSVRVYSAAATNEFTQWVEDQEEDPADPDFDENADVDGDGQTTYEEYLADTDPAASNSVLKIEGLSADLNQFSFPASPARFYQLEYCTEITNQAGTLVISNLGWGVPGMVITNVAPTSWFGVIRVLLNEP
ncbi:MAG: S8 family serine peptidase [Kiritimatiellia bacterium]